MFGIFVVFEALNLKRLRKLPIIDDHKLPENNIQITVCVYFVWALWAGIDIT